MGWCVCVCRRLRPSVPGDNSIPAVREQDDACTAPTGQLCAEGRDSSHPRVDAQMLYARAMGEDEAVARAFTSKEREREREEARCMLEHVTINKDNYLT